MKPKLLHFLKSIPILIISGLAILTLSHLQFTPWPEMLLWPYLINHGWQPYRDIAIIHSPLLPVGLTIFSHFFGPSITVLKILTWLLLMTTGLILFKYSQKKYSLSSGLAILSIYFLLLIRYQGNGLWFETLIMPLILMVYIFLARQKYLLAGCFFGLAFFTKQTAFWFAIPIAWELLRQRKAKTVFDFLLGSGAVALVVLGSLWKFHLLSDYYFWSVKFGVTELPLLSGHDWATPKQLLAGLWPFAGVVFIPFVKNRLTFLNYFFWGIFGMLGAFPRWELFHFQPALPFLALLIHHSLIQIPSARSTVRIIAFIYGFTVFLIIARSAVLNWNQPDRFFEPEIVQIISYVTSHTQTSDKIYVLNSWDHIYAMSDRLPASRPWIPDLSWYLELPGIQSEIVASLENTPPALIVFKEHDAQGLGAYRADQLEDYIFSHYSRSVGFGSGYWILQPKNQVNLYN